MVLSSLPLIKRPLLLRARALTAPVWPVKFRPALKFMASTEAGKYLRILRKIKLWPEHS